MVRPRRTRFQRRDRLKGLLPLIRAVFAVGASAHNGYPRLEFLPPGWTQGARGSSECLQPGLTFIPSLWASPSFPDTSNEMMYSGAAPRSMRSAPLWTCSLRHPSRSRYSWPILEPRLGLRSSSPQPETPHGSRVLAACRNVVESMPFTPLTWTGVGQERVLRGL